MDKKTLVGLAIIIGIVLILIGGMTIWMSSGTMGKGIIMTVVGGVVLWLAARTASLMEV